MDLPMGRVKRGATCGKEGEKRLTGKRLVAPLWLRMWPIISLGNLQMNDVFIGCYSRPLDGRRLCVPPEWARIFRDRGGVAAVELPSGRLALTTKEIAEKSSNTELLKAVHFKMDSRGRIIMPKVFRRMFKEVKDVVLCGSIQYVEIRRK